MLKSTTSLIDKILLNGQSRIYMIDVIISTIVLQSIDVFEISSNFVHISY